MSVSDKDREAAALAVIDARMKWSIQNDPADMDGPDAWQFIVDALIALGWGPKPTVSAKQIDEIIAWKWPTGAGSAANAFRTHLRECGIEVTE